MAHCDLSTFLGSVIEITAKNLLPLPRSVALSHRPSTVDARFVTGIPTKKAFVIAAGYAMTAVEATLKLRITRAATCRSCHALV
jgi:hypothetical protein